MPEGQKNNCSIDKLFLKLIYGFFKQNAAFDHLTHQRFELIFHGLPLRETLLSVRFYRSG